MNRENLRPVTVFKRVLYQEKQQSGKPYIPAVCKKEVVNTGFFHQFGLDLEEGESGFASYSTAIVELPSGEVITPEATLIRFDDTQAEKA